MKDKTKLSHPIFTETRPFPVGAILLWQWLSSARMLVLLAVVLLASTLSSRGIPLIEETFSSATGNLVGTTPAVGGIWTAVNSATDKIQVTSGSLTAPTGLLGSVGNKASWGGLGEDALSTFAAQNSGTVYYSLLLQVTSIPGAGGSNVVSLCSTSSATLAASLALRRDPVDTTKYNVGFFSRQTSNGPLFSTTQLSTGTTHFVVISYTFVAGSNNDIIKLWLNPTSFGGSEPAPTISLTNANGDVASLTQLNLWQRDSSTPNMSIDELIVATTWAEVTPPSGTPPSVITQPSTQSVNSGGTAVFSVVADGDPVPAYQWRKDGVNISGATGSTLTIANAAPADAGNYDVVITNTAGTVTSSAVALTVYVGLSKANNTTALNQTASWSGGAVPTASQVARWDSTITAARTAAIGGNISFKGIQVTNATGLQTISATTGAALTLGSQGIDLSTAATDLTVSAALNLGSDQAWKVATGRTLTIAPGSGISNAGTSTLSLAGPGKVRFGNGINFLGTGSVLLGSGVNFGSSNATGRYISNPVTLVGDITMNSTSTTGSGSIIFNGNISVGETDRTVTLVSTTGSANQPVFSMGNGTGKTLSGSGTLILINGNAGTTPATSVAFDSGITVQSSLRIGNAVTLLATSSNVIVSGGTLTVDAGGTFNMARSTAGSATSQTIGALTGAGLVTSNATTTSTGILTIDGGISTGTSTFSGQITNTAGASVALTKTGLNTQVLTGNNTYNGFTKVKTGTLRLGSNSPTASFLPAATALYLNTGLVLVDPADPEAGTIQNPEGKLDLSFANASIQQSVGSLYIDDVNQPKGIYGPVGSGAEFESNLITGTGLLRVGIITAQPAGTVVNAGANVTFTVSAVAGSSYQWKKNGNNISGALSSSLTLTNVQLADSADYTVQVTNGSISQLSAVATLVINQAPSITSQPVNATTVDGVNVSFSVAVTGYPVPTFQWRKNGVNISGATGSTLDLNGLLSTDAGSYTVVITNSLGSVTSSAATLVVNSQPNVINVQMGNQIFSWTFNQAVTRGYYVDGQPWVIKPAGTPLYLTAASPSRENGRTGIYNYPAVPTTADINITVINPPFDHYFDGNDYIDNPGGVFGWDSRSGTWGGNASSKFNASLGWDGVTPKQVFAGDCITTPKSVTELYDDDGTGPNTPKMPARGTPLDYLAVLTVVDAAPPSDAFRPGVIRPVSGTDRTNPEIIRFSDVIDLAPYLIPSPVGTNDLRGKPVTAIPSKYNYPALKAIFNGPGFLNTGDSRSEGAHALLNNDATPYGANYGGTVGNYMGQLAIGSLAGWLTEDQRKSCRIRLIQRAIDSYSAIKAGLCVEESAGILPGYSTLITLAGVMLDHDGMKDVNKGVNGVKPWFVFADYACMFHTGDVPAGDLAVGETQTDRGIPLYSATTTNYPLLSKKDIQPIAAATTDTFTAKTTFQWNSSSRPMGAIKNMKVRVTGGAGAGDTIYVITGIITDPALLTDDEKFRNEDGTLFNPNISNNTYGYYWGGKVQIKPAWQNGIPNSSSFLAFSITSNDPTNSQSDNASWWYQSGGVKPVTAPAKLDRETSTSTSPGAEYASVHTGGTIDNLIALYALGQEGIYKGAVDKYLIHSGTRPGHGEVLFSGSYLEALGSGSTGHFRGALWKQEALTPLGKSFIYTGLGTSALEVPNPSAKLWYEP